MSAAVETRRFDKPDQLLDMKARGRIAIVKMADGTAAMHAIFEPGCVWEVDEKPLLGNPPSCPMRHTGYCIAGRLIRSDGRDQHEDEHRPGRLLRDSGWSRCLRQGHERVELVLFAPPEHAH